MAADIKTGKTVWKTARKELPSWGTPTVVQPPGGGAAELVTNASNFIRGYDPETGEERWRLGGSSKITAPTPVFSNGPHHRRERPRARAADLRHQAGRHAATSRRPADGASSAHVAWRKTGRGSYMPTPLIYGDIVYVLGNAGLFDAYDLTTGAEIYRQRIRARRQRLQRVAGCRRRTIYLSSEDGDIFVVRSGRTFELLSKNADGRAV